jgi:hypothetical protein
MALLFLLQPLKAVGEYDYAQFFDEKELCHRALH